MYICMDIYIHIVYINMCIYIYIDTHKYTYRDKGGERKEKNRFRDGNGFRGSEELRFRGEHRANPARSIRIFTVFYYLGHTAQTSPFII